MVFNEDRVQKHLNLVKIKKLNHESHSLLENLKWVKHYFHKA